MVKIEPITPLQPPTKLDFLEYLKQEYSTSNDSYYDYHDSYYGYYDSYYNYQYYSKEELLLAEYNYEPTLADLETSTDLLNWFEEFQLEELRKRVSLIIFDEYFNGDWRSGQEVNKVVITQRLYQTSPTSTQV